MTFKMTTCWLFCMLLLPSTGWGEVRSWTLDTAHSGIHFEVRHIYSMVRGHFDDYAADLRIDPDNLTASSFSFTVKSKSINTYNRKRDNHLRGKDFLDSKRFPEITFASESIQHLGGDRYTATGTLTLHGESRKITAPFTFHGVGPNPFRPKENVIGFTATFAIKRLDYGVGSGKYVQMGTIGNPVRLQVSFEAIQ